MQKIYKIIFAVLIIAAAKPATALEAVTSDPRIRTFVYGKNDVFKIVSIFGYQTVVEFGADEKIITISVGNPNIFKLTPSRNRIFMKAMQNNQITNMTVITNMRTYQIDLSSVAENAEEIMYVVRFTYPEDIQKNEDSKTEANSPMQLYSPIAVSKQSLASQMPSLPSSDSMMPDTPSSDMKSPVSAHLRDSSERKGLNLSPVQVSAPSIF